MFSSSSPFGVMVVSTGFTTRYCKDEKRTVLSVTSFLKPFFDSLSSKSGGMTNTSTLLFLYFSMACEMSKAKFQPSTITLSQSPPSSDTFASTARRTVAAVVKRFGLSTITNVRVPLTYPKFLSLTCSGENGKAPKRPKTTCDRSPTRRTFLLFWNASF